MVLIRTAILLALAATSLVSCTVEDPQSNADSRYSVVITSFDNERKIRAIKTIREETGLGLADAKRLIEENRGVVKSGLSRSDANSLAKRLGAQRITVELVAE